MESFYKLFRDDHNSELNKEENSQNKSDFSIDTLGSLSSGSITNNLNHNINSNIYYDKKKFDFQQVEDIVNSQNIENFKNHKDLLEHFAEIEEIILAKIKINHENISKFYHKILKDMAFNTLENKIKEYKKYIELYKQFTGVFLNFFEVFYKTDSLIDLLEGEEQILKMLNENNLFDRNSSISISNSNFKKFHQDNGEKVSEILSIFKKISKKNLNSLIGKLNKHFGTKNFPVFLVRTAKYKIKKKINKKYLPKFKEIFLRNNFLSSFEYLIIVDKIKEISSNNLDLFDDRILNLEIREVILKIILVCCNHTFYFVKQDKFFAKLFEANLKKYFKILNTNVKYESSSSSSSIYLKESKLKSPLLNSKNITSSPVFSLNREPLLGISLMNNLNEESKSFSSKGGNIPDLFSSFDYSNTEIVLQDLFKQLEFLLKGDINKYLFVILSLLLLFNNYDIFNRVITQTSAREKECLKKILLSFNEYCRYENFDMWKFNQILESVIFSMFFKHRYSENLLENKETVIDKNNKLQSKGPNLKYRIMYEKYNQLILKEGEKLHPNFLMEYKLLIHNIPKEEKMNCCRSTLTFFKEFLFPHEEKQVFVNLQKSSLNPYDRYNHSNQVCIIIHGYMSLNHNNHKQWEGFINDLDIYVDFYFYTWDSKTGMKVINDIMKFMGGIALTLFTRNFLKVFAAYRTYQHKNNLFANTIKISKYFGKVLAYVLASKAFFENRSITLVGYSLGGSVLKHCLKELMSIAEYMPEVKDLIHNVIFIGGATSIQGEKKTWSRLPEFISGRIINCYSPGDTVLQGVVKYITKKDSLGIVPFNVIKKDKDSSTEHNFVENYDIGDWNIQHVEYKNYFNEILKTIKIFK